MILGGDDHIIEPDADFAVIPGGFSNEIGPDADFSFAAGRRAEANHIGSFVWADSTNADFTSTMPDQFRIRAGNGLSLARNGSGATDWPVGTYFRDNGIYAWGRVSSSGVLEEDFNVVSVTRHAAGIYTVELPTGLQSGFSLIAAVTPEVDGGGVVPPVPPIGAANGRIAVVDKVAAGNTFHVFIYNGSFALVDNDFDIVVTGR